MLLAMLRVSVRYQLLGLVIIPCTATLQVAEDELSLVLVALIAGTRPVISPAMLRQHQHDAFGILDDVVSVRCHEIEDFMIHISRREDLKIILSTQLRENAPFSFV
jgi:hypothetical protein